LRSGLALGWGSVPGEQGDDGVVAPGMFLAIEDEGPGEQFNFVAEELEGDGARQKGRIHEDAFAEGKVVGHGLWLSEKEGGGICGRREALPGEEYLDVGDGELGMVDNDGGVAGRGAREGDLPGAIASASVLDGLVAEGVTKQGEQKRQAKVFHGALWFHLTIQTG